MVAELSNPAFREKLKARNLWQRIIDSIANLFGFRKDSSNYAKISKNLSRIIDNYDTNFTKNYENIESNFTDFAKKNTIESKDSNQRKNMDLKDRFLDKNGDIDYEKFKEMPQIPKPKKYHEFRNSLLQSPNCISKIGKNTIIYQTPAGQIKIHIPYAYGHFSKHGIYGNNKENRRSISGALNLLLDKPAFVTKDTQGTLYFYKPFKIDTEFKDIVSISIDKNGKLEYKTTYEGTKSRMQQITNQESVYME